MIFVCVIIYRNIRWNNHILLYFSTVSTLCKHVFYCRCRQVVCSLSFIVVITSSFIGTLVLTFLEELWKVNIYILTLKQSHWFINRSVCLKWHVRYEPIRGCYVNLVGYGKEHCLERVPVWIFNFLPQKVCLSFSK